METSEEQKKMIRNNLSINQYSISIILSVWKLL